jgi:VanZ family protein
MTLGILFCTLWPFDPFPPNRVAWLEQTDGIRFSERGVVLSQEALAHSGPPSADTSCSLELWIKPAQIDSVSTILDIYETDDPWRFLVRQYHVGLIISHDVPNPGGRPVRLKMDIDDGLRSDQLSFITIVSGQNGTAVYFDGKLRKFAPHFQISSDDLSGQLVLGSSTVQSNAWNGEIRGLALYSRELTPEEVAGDYRDWTMGEAPSMARPNLTIAKYLFGERSGNIIHDQGIGQRDLFIPKTYQVPHHSFLIPPWREFDPSWDYFGDVLRNILGFMPLGFLLCALLSRSLQSHRAILCSILFGGALSLSIEILQAYIPQRGSGITDVITNTLGTALGALLVGSWLDGKSRHGLDGRE